MAIDNLPLFSAVNDEEVRHPAHPHHGHPSHPFDCAPHGRPFTRQEAHYEIMHRVEACIAEVHRFEERVRFEVNKFMQATNAENQAFKEALQAAHNCFLETIQNEVNNFEQSMRNDYDLFRSDIDQRFADFTTSINNAFDSLTTDIRETVDSSINNMLTTSEAMLDDLRAMQQNLNADYTNFKNSVNLAYQTFQTEINNTINTQNQNIENAIQWMTDNLPENVRIGLLEMILNGTMSEVLYGVFGHVPRFRGSYTYDEVVNGNAIPDAENGDYFYSTTDGHYYQYAYMSDIMSEEPVTDSGVWFDLGTGELIANQFLQYVNTNNNEVAKLAYNNSPFSVAHFTRFFGYKGDSTPFYWDATPETSKQVVDFDHYKSVLATDGNAYGFGGKLLNPIPVDEKALPA